MCITRKSGPPHDFPGDHLHLCGLVRAVDRQPRGAVVAVVRIPPPSPSERTTGPWARPPISSRRASSSPLARLCPSRVPGQTRGRAFFRERIDRAERLATLFQPLGRFTVVHGCFPSPSMADTTAAARWRSSVSPRRSPAVFLACAMATKSFSSGCRSATGSRLVSAKQIPPSAVDRAL